MSRPGVATVSIPGIAARPVLDGPREAVETGGETIPGCRDETRTRFHKTFRLTHGAERPRIVTADGWEYLLSTRGGRRCDDE